jgi:hypothetical protein
VITEESLRSMLPSEPKLTTTKSGGKGFRKIQRRYRPKLREVRRFLTRAERLEARKTGQLPMRLFKETTAPLKGRLRVKSEATGYGYVDWPDGIVPLSWGGKPLSGEDVKYAVANVPLWLTRKPVK